MFDEVLNGKFCGWGSILFAVNFGVNSRSSVSGCLNSDRISSLRYAERMVNVKG